jgi:hypothetical protein
MKTPMPSESAAVELAKLVDYLISTGRAGNQTIRRSLDHPDVASWLDQMNRTGAITLHPSDERLRNS